MMNDRFAARFSRYAGVRLDYPAASIGPSTADEKGRLILNVPR
jgi:hypothetical protein